VGGVTLAQARSASSAKVPGTNLPSGSSAGIPLMNKIPLASLARLNGKPAGSPGPEPILLIAIQNHSHAGHVIWGGFPL
jgi:hypothetical protein